MARRKQVTLYKAPGGRYQYLVQGGGGCGGVSLMHMTGKSEAAVRRVMAEYGYNQMCSSLSLGDTAAIAADLMGRKWDELKTWLKSEDQPRFDAFRSKRKGQRCLAFLDGHVVGVHPKHGAANVRLGDERQKVVVGICWRRKPRGK